LEFLCFFIYPTNPDLRVLSHKWFLEVQQQCKEFFLSLTKTQSLQHKPLLNNILKEPHLSPQNQQSHRVFVYLLLFSYMVQLLESSSTCTTMSTTTTASSVHIVLELIVETHQNQSDIIDICNSFMYIERCDSLDFYSATSANLNSASKISPLRQFLLKYVSILKNKLNDMHLVDNNNNNDDDNKNVIYSQLKLLEQLLIK